MAAKNSAVENFAKLRKTSKRLVQTPFQHSWQWKIVFSGNNVDAAAFPNDFDLYVKDISYGPYEIETDAIKTGLINLTFISGVEPVTVTMTLRDNEDQEIYTWIEKQIQKSYNPDGTVCLPDEYRIKMERYALPDDGTREVQFPADPWEGFFSQLGDIEESRDEPGFLEFPATFVQFRS